VREGGAIDRRVPVGAGRHAFACMLGGADRRTLYACTCTGSGPAVSDKRDGRIERVPVDVPGAGLP
jgi:sugar lactone lactonase YvrE